MQPSAPEGFPRSYQLTPSTSRVAIPRYDFDFQDGEMWLMDEKGDEYESLQVPRDAAIVALRDIAGEAPPPNDKGRSWPTSATRAASGAAPCGLTSPQSAIPKSRLRIDKGRGRAQPSRTSRRRAACGMD